MTTPTRPLDDEKIDHDLRIELAQAWMLGALTYMNNGQPVTPAHSMPAPLVAPLLAMAEAAIAQAQDLIATTYTENPTEVRQALYLSGYESCRMADLINAGYDVEALEASVN